MQVIKEVFDLIKENDLQLDTTRIKYMEKIYGIIRSTVKCPDKYQNHLIIPADDWVTKYVLKCYQASFYNLLVNLRDDNESSDRFFQALMMLQLFLNHQCRRDNLIIEDFNLITTQEMIALTVLDLCDTLESYFRKNDGFSGSIRKQMISFYDDLSSFARRYNFLQSYGLDEKRFSDVDLGKMVLDICKHEIKYEELTNSRLEEVSKKLIEIRNYTCSQFW